MKKFVLLILLISYGFTQIPPCTNYACDSLAVRTILDMNGYTDITVEKIHRDYGGRNNEGRIIELRFGMLPNIDTIPEVLGKINKAWFLYFSDGKFSNLPKSIGNLIDLENITLSETGITELPKEIGNLAKLKVLKLNKNIHLSAIPEHIGALTNLTSLDVDGNSISIIPSQIGELINLDQLSFRNNNISRIPTEVGNLVKLSQLHFSGNIITEVPDFIGNLVNLKSIEGNNNNITKIPITITNLIGLESMKFTSNKISEFPNEFTSLNSLKLLYFDRNNIESLPEGISNLSNLRDLIFSYNNLSKLPESLMSMQVLYNISIIGNRLCGLSFEMLKWYDDTYGNTNSMLETQRMDDAHYCDGTSNEGLIKKPFNDIIINYIPFTNHVTITFQDFSKTNTIHIYNTNGNQVIGFEDISESVTWNTAGLNRGVYYLKAGIGDRQIVRKFVLE